MDIARPNAPAPGKSAVLRSWLAFSHHDVRVRASSNYSNDHRRGCGRCTSRFGHRPTSNNINCPNCHAQTSRECDHSAVDAFPDAAQADRLRADLWRLVDELSEQVEQAECKERRLSDWSHRRSRSMRAQLYEAHHLIDALNRRFPAPDADGPSVSQSVCPGASHDNPLRSDRARRQPQRRSE